jgi:hypothetical protein
MEVKLRETSVRIADVQAHIQTQHLMNTSLKRYHYTKSLVSKVFLLVSFV